MNNHDPRPDLETDSDAWKWFLRLAYPGKDVKEGGELYDILVDFRRNGAVLNVSIRGNYQISAGAIDPTEYRLLLVKMLMPHHERVTDLLRQLKQVVPPTATEIRAEEDVLLETAVRA
jgi:hypothetical protein